MGFIYFIIIVLIIATIYGVWNSTKEFEDVRTRVVYFIFGILFMTFITLLLFGVSRIGVVYPKQEMIGQVRKIMLLVFVPINSFIMLPQVANLISRIKNGEISSEQKQKRIRILLLIFALMIIFECIYFKHVQNGIINVINRNN